MIRELTIRELSGAILFALTLIALFAVPAHPEKRLFNYDVPIAGCLKKATLLDCDPASKPMQCGRSRIRFASESCLILEAK